MRLLRERMRMKKLGLIVMAALLAIAVAGCGSGNTAKSGGETGVKVIDIALTNEECFRCGQKST